MLAVSAELARRDIACLRTPISGSTGMASLTAESPALGRKGGLDLAVMLDVMLDVIGQAPPLRR